MKTRTQTLALLSLSGLFVLGAASAYAAEPVLTYDDGQSRVWTIEKTAVTPVAAVDTSAALRNIESLPDLVVPLNTRMEMQAVDTPSLIRDAGYNTQTDLRDFDLVEDDPVFIGAQSRSEFDTLDAQRSRAAMPSSLGVDPLIPVAGAGLATAF